MLQPGGNKSDGQTDRCTDGQTDRARQCPAEDIQLSKQEGVAEATLGLGEECIVARGGVDDASLLMAFVFRKWMRQQQLLLDCSLLQPVTRGHSGSTPQNCSVA